MDFYPSLPWVQSFGKKCCEICSVPHVLAPRKLKNREKVGSDVISAPQIAPWVIQSACKKKKKVNTNTWNENISPQSHTQSAVCQSRKDWQPKPSLWCPMSLKGSLGGLSMFNTTSRGSGRSSTVPFHQLYSAAVAPLLLWDLSRDWTRPQDSKAFSL